MRRRSPTAVAMAGVAVVIAINVVTYAAFCGWSTFREQCIADFPGKLLKLFYDAKGIVHLFSPGGLRC